MSHVTISINDAINTNCLMCKEKFLTKPELDLHIKTKHLQMYICSKCPLFSTLIKARLQRHLEKIHSACGLQENVKILDAKPDENSQPEKAKVDHNLASQDLTEPAPKESLTNESSVNLGDDDEEENFRHGCDQCWFAAETAEELSKHVETKHKVVEIVEDAGEKTINQSSSPMDELAQVEPPTPVETIQGNDMDIDGALVEMTSQSVISDLPLIIDQCSSNEEIVIAESNQTNSCNESGHSRLLNDDAISANASLDTSTNPEIVNLDSIKDFKVVEQANAINKENITKRQDVITIDDCDESKDPELCQQLMEVSPEGNPSNQSSHPRPFNCDPVEIVEIEDSVSVSTDPILSQHPTKDAISVDDVNYLAIETEQDKNDPQQGPKVAQLLIETDVPVQAELEVTALPQEAVSFGEKSTKRSEEPEVIQLPIEQTSNEDVQLLEVAEQTPDEEVQLLEVSEQTSVVQLLEVTKDTPDDDVQLLEVSERTDKKQLSEKLQPEAIQISFSSPVTVDASNDDQMEVELIVVPLVTDPKPVESIVDLHVTDPKPVVGTVDPVSLSSTTHSEDLCMDTGNQTENVLAKETEIFKPTLDVRTEAVQEVTDVQMDEVTITSASVSENKSTDEKEKLSKFIIGCNLCDFLTTNATAMEDHLGWNGHFKLGQENLCVFCTFMASTKEEFVNHVKQLHSDTFTLAEWCCSKCDYKSKNGDEMEDHCSNH